MKPWSFSFVLFTIYLVLVSPEHRFTAYANEPVKETAEQTKNERAIIGEWRVISRTRDGKEAQANGESWEFFEANKLVVIPGIEGDGQYNVVTKKKSHWDIDVETAEDKPDFGGGGPRKGIVSIEGDKLTLCLNGSPKAPRPEKMTSTKPDLTILYKMERIKNNK